MLIFVIFIVFASTYLKCQWLYLLDLNWILHVAKRSMHDWFKHQIKYLIKLNGIGVKVGCKNLLKY